MEVCRNVSGLQAATRTVCVKILTPEGASDKETRARFLAEAKMSASLVHDNIIRIFDYGEQDGKPYIVMEFLTGGDLRSAISAGTSGDVASQLRILLEGARALQYVHQKQLIHRDIKPDNLHVDTQGRVRLMDFGSQIAGSAPDQDRLSGGYALLDVARTDHG